MTEQEWTDCDQPEAFLAYLRERGSERKLRYFASACCRLLLPPGDPLHTGLDIAEEVAEGHVGEELDQLWGDWLVMLIEGGDPLSWAILQVLSPNLVELKTDEILRFSDWVAGLRDGSSEHAERARQAALIRCLLQNPSQRAGMDPAARTPTVIALARDAYEERLEPSCELDPMRLAVLADALEEVGAPGEVVAHLRGSGPHVRGCFALDLVLGLT